MGFLNKCNVSEKPLCKFCKFRHVVRSFYLNALWIDFECHRPSDKECFENFIMDRFMKIE